MKTSRRRFVGLALVLVFVTVFTGDTRADRTEEASFECLRCLQIGCPNTGTLECFDSGGDGKKRWTCMQPKEGSNGPTCLGPL